MRTVAAATPNARTISAKCGNGGAAAGWFSGMRANARPARRAGPIVRLPLFRRSVAGQGHAQEPRVTLPRGASDQRKRAEAGASRSPTPRGTHQGRDQGGDWGTDPGGSRGAGKSL